MQNVIFARRFSDDFITSFRDNGYRKTFPEDGVFHSWMKINGQPPRGAIETVTGEVLLLHYELFRFTEDISDILEKKKTKPFKPKKKCEK